MPPKLIRFLRPQHFLYKDGDKDTTLSSLHSGGVYLSESRAGQFPTIDALGHNHSLHVSTLDGNECSSLNHLDPTDSYTATCTKSRQG